ncbi:MAG: glycoside hydrolase [Acidobacteriota bacterium]|nr:glycoside hydrolase [Acidobacteriota bacterium]
MAGSSVALSQQFDQRLYQGMRWRMIGPFRGGRTVGASGVPGRPNVYYVGVNNGGVWKTDDYGRTWVSLFDDQPTGSVGALAVAPSQPDTIYVGSGEGLQRPDLSVGDGLYKSTDGGRTWEHLGLRDGQQIGAILVDPKNADRLFVAVLGHPYGPNAERGVFRSTDGGRTFEKVLYKDENTGAIGLAFDPKNSKTIYATLWAARQGPWENGQWQGPGSGLFKSTDGGSTWKQLTKGLPTIEQGLGRIGIAVAPSDPKRLYANVDATHLGGVYRSDDAGESWQRVNDEVRVWGRGSDFAEVKVDPRDPEIVYSANTSTYRSTDGGHTYHAWKGAPGGDDYHTVWINPENPEIVLLASDQGATLTVNGGRTWSSWYNQPTAQFYHVSTDNQFPYWVYGGQQESGSIGTTSRGDNGAITFRDWRTVGAEEYGYVAADPLNPNLIYGGKLTRFDKTTGQAQNVAPEAVRSGKYRFLRTAPVLFSPVDPHVLYYAGNVIFKTTNGGNSWDIISPDLTRERYDVPASIGVYSKPEMAQMPRRGVIYTVAPSPKDINVIWAGTDDGLIHVTRDGGRAWANVTPPALTSWSKVSIIDAGHFDTQTAYAAVNRFRLDDLRPHIYRTHDGGRTWTEIVNGLPDDPINVVREDPVRRGLLFAGSERAVYVSFDDGDHWQSLRLNMAASSVRDLVIHKDDIVVGTHGRSFWILDDITPLRQISAEVAASDAFLFQPETAYRVQRNVNTDTPLPPEEPAGQNPPDGAIINYYLKSDSQTPVTLEIYDRAGRLVRRFSSADKPEPVNEKEINVPLYWVRPPRTVSAKAGMQRFVWDLHYPEPKARNHEYPISANYMDTPHYPLGPVVLPGDYTVKLNAAGRTFTRPLTVVIDPRVKTPRPGLEQQFRLSLQTAEGMTESFDALEQLGHLRAQIKDLRARAGIAPALADALAALDKKAAALEGEGGPRGTGGPAASEQPGLSQLHSSLATLLDVLQQADAAPTTQGVAAAADLQQKLRALISGWNELKSRDVQALNLRLLAAGLPPLAL